MNFNDVLLAIPNQLAKNFDSFYRMYKKTGFWACVEFVKEYPKYKSW